MSPWAPSRQRGDAVGWSIENCRADANPDRGEANDTGDILETALLLGSWGDAQAYPDAERILRGHLLPSQLRDVSFIQEPANRANEGCKRDVAERHLGAFGFPVPYGHAPLGFPGVGFNMDIVGGATASPCEALRHVVTATPGGQSVNLLFDHKTDGIRIDSPYPSGELRIMARRPGPISVRIPPWIDSAAVSVTGAEAAVSDAVIAIGDPPVGSPITVMLALTEHAINLPHCTRTIRVRLCGDEVVAMDNFGADLTFFPPF